jgi:hypothetical protein
LKTHKKIIPLQAKLDRAQEQAAELKNRAGKRYEHRNRFSQMKKYPRKWIKCEKRRAMRSIKGSKRKDYFTLSHLAR